MKAQAWRLKLSRIVTELAQLLAPLNAVLFTFGNDRVSVAELLGFATGAASVYLTVRAHISNFPVGIANSAFFLVLFLRRRLHLPLHCRVVIGRMGGLPMPAPFPIPAGRKTHRCRHPGLGPRIAAGGAVSSGGDPDRSR